MPALPTLTVTTEQQTRMIAAWKPEGGTNAQAIEAYKHWLSDQIIEFVKDKEWQDRLVQIQQERATMASTARGDLTPAELVPPPIPPPVP